MMRNHFIVAVLLGVSLVAFAEEPTRSPAALLGELKAECVQPTAPGKPVWTSYLSETERIRWRIMGDLGKQKDVALPMIREEKGKADGDYQQMLTVCLAALGDADAIADTTNLLLNAKAPAVRVCAAKALRDARDKKSIPALQAAMRDPHSREDGSCVTVGDGKCHPVRIVAGDALGTLGFTREQINGLEKDGAQQGGGHVR
jgi:hypothetical protein